MDHLSNILNGTVQSEWRAWQNVVKVWPGDMNAPQFNRMVKWCQFWGESFAQLVVDKMSLLNFNDPATLQDVKLKALHSTFEKELRALAQSALKGEEWRISQQMHQGFYGALYTWARALARLRLKQDQETRQIAFNRAKQAAAHDPETH